MVLTLGLPSASLIIIKLVSGETGSDLSGEPQSLVQVMNERQRTRWKKIRAQGFLRFLLFYGVILMGGLTFLLAIMGKVIFHERFSKVSLGEEIIFSVIGGLAWGVTILCVRLLIARRAV